MKANELKELHIVTRGRCADGQGQYELAVVARRNDDAPGQGSVVRKISGEVEASTHNEAHYHAVIAAVEYLDALTVVPPHVPLFIHTPSDMVAGVKKTKAPHLVPLRETLSEMAGRIHIQRLSGAQTRQVLAM